MRRKLIEVARIIVVSPELLIVLLIYAISCYWNEPFEVTGQHFIDKDKLWEFIPALPLGLLYFSVSLSFQLQAPVESANRELYDWGLYWALKYRIIASIAWSGLATACSLVIWMFSKALHVALVGLLFYSSIGISLVVAITEILALFALKEILTK